MSSENGEPLAISLMPMEVILMISCNLPTNSRALLSLTCKRFWDVIPRHTSKTEHLYLSFPGELPPNFQESTMSDPQLFRPERYEFLRLLERDISNKWLLCFDCFILHPTHLFVKPKTPLLPWLKRSGGLLDNQCPPRSCRYLSRAMPNQEVGSSSLSGVADLCPCVHMTPAKRDRVQASRDTLTQNGPYGQNHCHGHSCVQVYDDIELKIILIPFLYEKDGELGFRLYYGRKSPINSTSVCPRMLCPHVSLDTLIKTFS